VKELADDGIPVAVTCRVLKLARQPYYRWLANPVTDAELVEAYRANALFDAHRDDPEFGYRFLVAEAGDAGRPMAERTAWRICSNNGWWSVFGKRKRGKNGKVGPPVHDDLVGRDFTADSPNRLCWLILPNTAPGKASSTCVRSRTCFPTGSSATPSTRG
jgi:putative transposase